MTTLTAAATTAADLFDRLLRDTAPFILDVRNPDDVARWRIEGRNTLESCNIPYYEFIEDADTAIAMIPTDREILVVCAKEGSSQFVADLLLEHGIAASYLAGGILSWGHYYDTREIAHGSWGTILQIARPARGDLSYLIVSGGAAAVIDPLRNTQPYLAALAETGATLRYVFDTHVHADHISGGPQLSRQTGAPYAIHPYDALHPIDMLPARLDYTPLSNGQIFQLGEALITTIWYPGHTLGQVNFLVQLPGGSRFLLTGDGIFLRSFGRPDLGGQGEAWTPLLYESMTSRLLPFLTDDTCILPAHFATLDECDTAGRCTDTWGTIRRTNEALAHLESPDQFSRFVLGNLPHFPPQYVEIKRVNLGLSAPSDAEADELELGKNICALAQ
ncbi:MAG TPA: MBL fold metallo-hydrolase [Roseiflexaceae bacterium]|nr:MBL fold metallo-hydrolase [Roseiflexaceae bacterium]